MKTKWGNYPDDKIPESNDLVGRIISRNREIYKIGADENVYTGTIKGKLLFESSKLVNLPVIGDWVLFELHGDIAIINNFLPRTSVISRKTAGETTQEQAIAANIDFVGIVFGLDGGRSYNPRALERYLTISWNSGAQPVVILNKADLCDDSDAIKREAEYIAPGVEVLVVSALNGTGVDPLFSMVKNGLTIVLIGPSGVGKSALTNSLLGKYEQKTGENRKNDKRGRHTTSSSCMFSLLNGGILIDSPGLREIQLWGEPESIGNVFDEINTLASLCRFNDCSHQGEPGCAVQNALAEGKLDLSRFENYLELKKEMDYLTLKKDEKARHELRARDKKFGKMVKAMKNKKEMY